VSDKKIAFLGWAFKKDTNDTRESAAIYVADHLIEDGAHIHVYDPKVKAGQIVADMRYLWELKGINPESIERKLKQIHIHEDPYTAMEQAHAVAVITEWDEFRSYDWKRAFDGMYKPAFLFDGRNILDKRALEGIGFQVTGIGK
jgi:UDPglucose 6-dehydrogenase